MKTVPVALVCLLLAAGAMAQSSPEPQLKERVNTPTQELQPADDNVAPNAPVITIPGLCEKPELTSPSAADCKTVITKEQFEKVLDAVQPNMPKPAQKQFAERYVAALMLADKAHELGLDHGPEFDELMQIQRLQLLARLAMESEQKNAVKVTDADIEGFYQQHSGDFKTVSYDRIYVPKQKQDDTIKPNDPDAQKKRSASEQEMKAEADKLRARAAAGGDFAKLQQEAYDFAGLKLKATNTHVDKVSKRALPPSDASIFDLKKGEVSQVLNDPQGFMIYKVDEVQEQPLADVRDEISRALQQQKAQQFYQSVQKSAAAANYDNAYFVTPAAPSLRNPGESGPPPAAQAPAAAAPGKK